MFSISDQRFDALPLRVSATFKNSHFCHDGKAEILSSLSQHLKLAVHGYLVGSFAVPPMRQYMQQRLIRFRPPIHISVQDVECRCADPELFIALDSGDLALLPLGVVGIPAFDGASWPAKLDAF